MEELKAATAEAPKSESKQANSKEAKWPLIAPLHGYVSSTAFTWFNDSFGVVLDLGSAYGQLAKSLRDLGAGLSRYVVVGVEYNTKAFKGAVEDLNATHDFESAYQFRVLNEENVADVVEHIRCRDSSKAFFFYGRPG